MPAFSAPTGFEAGDTPRSLVAVDVNRDGRPDLVTANSGSIGTAGVTVLLNTTTAGAAAPSFAGPTPLGTGIAPRGVAAPDLNGDGRPDLATADSGETDMSLSVLVNGTAAGGSIPSFSEAQRHSAGANRESVTAADLNRDAKVDLVTGDIVVLNATEPGEEIPAFDAPVGLAAGGVIAADLNADARPDLVVPRLDPAQHDAAPAEHGPVEPRVRESGARHHRRAEDRHALELDAGDAPRRRGLSGHTDDMLVSRNTCGDGVPGDGACSIAIRFAPGATGPRRAT